jgi:hypothetical protein
MHLIPGAGDNDNYWYCPYVLASNGSITTKMTIYYNYSAVCDIYSTTLSKPLQNLK